MSEVKLEINDKNGFFHIDVDGKQEAKMTFVFAGDDKIIIDHTRKLIRETKARDLGNKW